MTYGEETKLDHIGKNKKLVAQKRLQDLTEEELIDSSKNFILSIFVKYTNMLRICCSFNSN